MSFYDDASWLLIPSGIEEDVVFAQKPTSGLGDLTFTRASDATYTDSTGVVRRSPYNLATSSSDFSQSYSLLNSTITTNTITDPFGTLLGDSQLETIATDVHAGYNDYTVLVGSQYTFSVYVKSINGRDVRVSGSSGFGGPIAIVNLSNGAILSSVGTIQVTNAGNGWYRISITATATTTTARILIYSTVGTQTTFAGDVTKGVYLFGRQFVEGSSALDYFPTTDRQNVPRIDFRNADGTLSSCGRLLLEPQRTNSIRNSSMVGAVAGSPGTAPTNWTTSPVGLTQTIVGIGTEDGLPYIDFRFNGTATGTDLTVGFEGSNVIVAANGQAWANSSYLKVVAQPSPPLSIVLNTVERTSAGAFVASGSSAALSLTSSLNRFSFVRTLSGGATVERVQPRVLVTLTNGAAYDFTIRIAAPQMELGAYATTWVPTTTAPVTRIADTASKTGVSSLIGQTEGTLYYEGVASADAEVCNLNRNTINSVFIYTRSTGVIAAFIYADSVGINIISAVQASSRFKCAIAYKSNSIAFYVNGNLIAENTTATFTPNVTLDRIDVALGGFVSNKNTVNCSQAVLFPTRLTNAQLAELTTL